MNPNQHFHGYELGPDFDRARTQIATPFQYVDIALDAAAANQVYNVSGDFLYIDTSSTGTVTVELNNQYTDAAAPFQVSAGFGINAVFKQLKVSWAAQAGKKIRLMYSTGERVVPTNSTAISGTVAIANNGMDYSGTFNEGTTLGAGAVSTVVAPASNVNGLVIINASFISKQATTPMGVFLMAKTSAPTGMGDGDMLLCPDTWNYAAGDTSGSLKNSIKVAAGKGLYWFNNTADAQPGRRHVVYRLL